MSNEVFCLFVNIKYEGSFLQDIYDSEEKALAAKALWELAEKELSEKIVHFMKTYGEDYEWTDDKFDAYDNLFDVVAKKHGVKITLCELGESVSIIKKKVL